MPLSAEDRRRRASLAARTRWGSEQTPETLEFQQAAEEAALDEHIAAVVASAPQLTTEQADKLRRLFRYGPAAESDG